MYVLCLVAQSCLTLCNPTECSPPGSSVHGEFSRKEYWSGCQTLLQGIFPTQGLNSDLLHCRQILYRLSHQGSPRKQKWVAYPFSSRSSWCRNWIGVSRIAGRFFIVWATREAQINVYINVYIYINMKESKEHNKWRGEEIVWTCICTGLRL